jgi:hypothetical protein
MAGSLHVKMLDAGAPEVLASKNSVTRLDVFRAEIVTNLSHESHAIALEGQRQARW